MCSAWLLLGSVGHLLTNDDALRCFQRAKDALKPGGTLILELPHPRETFRVDGVSEDGWDVPFEGGDLRVRWGAEEDAFDPLTQIRQASVAFETDQGQSITDVVPTREYTLQELRLLSKAAGFVDVATYGALDPELRSADDDELAPPACCCTDWRRSVGCFVTVPFCLGLGLLRTSGCECLGRPLTLKIVPSVLHAAR